MAEAYNKSFRKLVLKECARLKCVTEVAAKFGIGRRSVQRWLKLQRLNLDLAPQTRKSGPRKANYALFETMVRENPDITQQEIAKAVGMSSSGVGRALKRIGIVFKKKRYYIKKEM